MKAIILAAGFATRLYPLTEQKPKALLEIGGRPILDYLVEKLEKVEVIKEIILVVNGKFYLDFFKWRKNSEYKKTIHILDNGAFVPEKRLGAVRDLYAALRSGYCGSDDFLVLCGDNYFDFPIGHFLLPCLGHRVDSFVGVYDVKDKHAASDCGMVGTDEHNLITSFEEKPIYPKSTKASIGVYYFPREYRLKIYEYLEIDRLNPDRIGDFVAWLSKRQDVYAVDFDGIWMDIGTPDSYEAAKRYFGTTKLLFNRS